MIEVHIKTEDGKIATHYKERGLEWNDICFLIAEFEKIKARLLTAQFDEQDENYYHRRITDEDRT